MDLRDITSIMVFIVIALFWKKWSCPCLTFHERNYMYCATVGWFSVSVYSCSLAWFTQNCTYWALTCQVYEQFSSFLSYFAVNILYLHWAHRTKIFVYYWKNCCKLMKVFYNILPQWRHSLCVGARPYILCCVHRVVSFSMYTVLHTQSFNFVGGVLYN
jgi:hypothetical protein